MQRLPGLQWLKVDLGESNSELAREYSIQQVPHLQIYDPEGHLVVEGPPALEWIRQRMESSR